MRLDCQTGSKTSLPGPGTQKVVERGAKEGEDISGALSMPIFQCPSPPLSLSFAVGCFRRDGLLFNLRESPGGGAGVLEWQDRLEPRVQAPKK